MSEPSLPVDIAAMSFEDVDMEGQGGEEGARQAAGLRLHDKIVNVLEMEGAEHN